VFSGSGVTSRMLQSMNPPETKTGHETPLNARLAPYTIALVSVVVTTGLAFMIHRILPHASLSLLFLTGILLVSVRTGLRSGLVASVLSFLAYNYFFTPPQFTLKVDDDGDVATLMFFLIMAAISGNLAARIHREMRQRQDSLQRISRMFDFGHRLSSAVRMDDVLNALVEELAGHLKGAVSAWLPVKSGGFRRAAVAGPVDDVDLGALREAWDRETSLPQERDGSLVLKLVISNGPAGLVVVQPHPRQRDSVELARSFCDQAAIALDRTLLASDLDEARLATEREQLRSALLSSLSHDLRTPLASVIGSTSSVLELDDVLDEKNRRELLHNALEEAQRLDRYIQNLLDMTRIGQGGLSLDRNWVDIHDIVAAAAKRLGLVPGQPPLQVEIEPDYPLLWVHGALIEQALVNLLDNALRFSPPGGQVRVTARASGDRATIEVADEGPGIPEGELEKVFEMFHTVRDRSGPQGSGLGLAICRSMVAAHAGSVVATNAPGGGARLTITLPVKTPEEPQA